MEIENSESVRQDSSGLGSLAPQATAMNRSSTYARKVGIIGAGSVGATIAYAAMIRGVARHISLFDIAKSKVDAEVLDLNHGLLFAPQATVDGADDVEVLRDCDVVVMTAGAKQKPGE